MNDSPFFFDNLTILKQKQFHFMLKIFFLILVCQLIVFSQTSWVKLNSPVTANLNKVNMIDSLHIYAAGDSGTIIRTFDGGVNWEIVEFPLSYEIIDFYCYSYDVLWVVLRNIVNPPLGSMIYRTTDGGERWEEASEYFEDIFLTTITFIDSLNGWCSGAIGNLSKTTDGGVTWTHINDPNIEGFPILSLEFISPQIGFGSGGHFDFAGGIIKTLDSGNTWSLQLVGPEPIQALYIFDSLNIIGVGGDYEFGTGIVRTTDGGVNWNYESLDFFGIAVSVAFRNRKEGWGTIGFGKGFIFTNDSGKTWTMKPTPDSASIYDIKFSDERNGFSVGDNGTILKFDPDVISVSESRTSEISNFILEQNYPNPFNPSTFIKFQIPTSIPVSGKIHTTLKVFNVLGVEISNLINDELSPGIYSVDFNAEGLSSGIYFYRLQAGNFSETKKMILLR